METPDYNNAKQKALALLKETNTVVPPVDVDDLIMKEGLKIEKVVFGEKFNDVSGFLDIPEKAIYVNLEDSYGRQNFTKAHELGHWVLHRTLFETHPSKQVLLRQANQNTTAVEEKEANVFAAELLIPKYLYLYTLGSCPDADIDRLADLFQVSKQFMAYRMINI
ncbi:MAG: ImmA/IrrE family metallo-endopeptidase [Endomicrobium sp.]|nr:ImmA/IrrE family metallo-endopeptidase [Endomicrobium sp.]